MLPFAYYLLKVIICSAVLYGYYWCFLRNKVFHEYNRFYLLAVVALSLTLPLLKFNIWDTNQTQDKPVIKLLQVVNTSDQIMDEVIIYSSAKHITKEQIILWIFVVTSFIIAFSFIRVLLKIRALKNENPAQEYDGISLVHTHDKSTPFSFLKNIFWNDAININTDNGGRILKHELAHVHEKHSHDKIFLNIVMIFFWANPIFWLLRKELHLLHEFLADKKAVEDGDTTAFASMILQATYPRHQFELTNNFFYSPIKRRLAMLTKNNKKVNYISRLLVLPLAVLVFAAFTFKSKKINNFSPLDQTITVVIDAGHGGTDNGALAQDGTYEKNINLFLAKKIKELNTNKNIRIILSRDNDVQVTPQQRVELAKKNKADLFISIHADNGPQKEQSDKSGASIWVARDQYNNAVQSKLLASALIGSFQNGYGLPVVASPMQREKTGIMVLQELTVPSVLIEAAFMNNKKDLEYLKSTAGQEAFANKVLEAIYSFAANMVVERSSEAILADVGKAGSLKGKATSVKISKTEDVIEVPVKSKTETVEVRPVFNLKADSFIVDASEYVVNNQSKKSILKQGIAIRGMKTPGADPIFILDGTVISKSDLEALDPETISVVHMLKGASAIEKYGADAANGVVEITTKRKESNTPQNSQDSSIKRAPAQHPITFTQVENEAQFPGGAEAWRKYLTKNIDASMPVKERWATGTYHVMVSFIVDTDGSVKNIVTENYKNSKTAEVCIDLIKKGPKWLPAKQNGKVVRAYRKQPITFVVTES